MPKIVMTPTPRTLSKQVKNLAISRKSPKIRVVFNNPIDFCRIGVIKTLGTGEALYLHAIGWISAHHPDPRPPSGMGIPKKPSEILTKSGGPPRGARSLGNFLRFSRDLEG